MELRKSYRGFLLWLLAFTGSMFLMPLLPLKDEALLTRLILVLCDIWIAVLAYIIFRTEHIDWYNGIDYKTALQAGSARRRLYAWRHLKRFGLFALISVVVSAGLQLLHAPIWIDIVFFCVGLIAVAISTIRIRL